MLVTKRERGEGEIPERWEVCQGHRRRSASTMCVCRGELAGWQQARSSSCARKGEQTTGLCYTHQKVIADTCAAASTHRCPSPGSPLGPVSPRPEHLHVQPLGVATTDPVSKVVLILYLGYARRACDRAVCASLRFSLFYFCGVFLSIPNKPVVAKWSWKTSGFLSSVLQMLQCFMPRPLITAFALSPLCSILIQSILVLAEPPQLSSIPCLCQDIWWCYDFPDNLTAEVFTTHQ